MVKFVINRISQKWILWLLFGIAMSVIMGFLLTAGILGSSESGRFGKVVIVPYIVITVFTILFNCYFGTLFFSNDISKNYIVFELQNGYSPKRIVVTKFLTLTIYNLCLTTILWIISICFALIWKTTGTILALGLLTNCWIILGNSLE